MDRCIAVMVVVALSVACGDPVPKQAAYGPQVFDTTSDSQGADTVGLAAAASAGGDDGIWALATEWSTCVEVGDLRLELKSYKLLRVEVATAGVFWQEKRQVCSVKNSPLLGQATVFPPKLIASLPVMPVASARKPDGSYLSSFEAQVIGVLLANPLLDDMPLDAADPRVFDSDKDGNPGGTLQVGTLCEVYQANRARSQIFGQQVAAGRIEGGALHSVSQVFLGGTSAFCTQPFPTTDNHPEHRFVLVKALAMGLDTDGDGAVTCNEIIAGQEKIITWRPADDKRCQLPK